MRRTAECFAVGEFVEEELRERGWSIAELASRSGIRKFRIVEILHGERAVDQEVADGLSRAFGTGSQVWLNLEQSWQEWRRQMKEGWPDVD